MTPLKHLAVGWILLASPAWAQAPPQSPEPQASDLVSSVLVEADAGAGPLRFARSITQLSASGLVSRWAVPPCPLVAGLTAAQNKAVERRLRAAASEAGTPQPTKDCKPNLTVIFADEPKAFIVKARAARKIAFPGASPLAIERIQNSAEPFRIWRQIEDVPSYGATSQDEGGTTAFYGAPGSLIRQTHASGILSATIIADKSLISRREMKLTTLSSYLCVVALSSIDPSAKISGFPSILNIANEKPSEISELTAWDRAYLKALYSSAKGFSGQVEFGHLARQMSANLKLAPGSP